MTAILRRPSSGGLRKCSPTPRTPLPTWPSRSTRISSSRMKPDMRTSKWKLVIGLSFALQAQAVCGAEYDKERYLRPVVLDSQDAAGASIGLEYRIADKLEKNLDSSQGGGTAGSAPGFGSAILSSLFIGYE